MVSEVINTPQILSTRFYTRMLNLCIFNIMLPNLLEKIPDHVTYHTSERRHDLPYTIVVFTSKLISSAPVRPSPTHSAFPINLPPIIFPRALVSLSSSRSTGVSCALSPPVPCFSVPCACVSLFSCCSAQKRRNLFLRDSLHTNPFSFLGHPDFP